MDAPRGHMEWCRDRGCPHMTWFCDARRHPQQHETPNTHPSKATVCRRPPSSHHLEFQNHFSLCLKPGPCFSNGRTRDLPGVSFSFQRFKMSFFSNIPKFFYIHKSNQNNFKDKTWLQRNYKMTLWTMSSRQASVSEGFLVVLGKQWPRDPDFWVLTGIQTKFKVLARSCELHLRK